MMRTRKAAAAKKTADPGASFRDLLLASPGFFDDAAAQELLESHPEAARSCGFPLTVIHQALYLRASATTIRLLGDACPVAVRLMSDGGETVLNTACRLAADLDVVRVLCDLWPGALGVKHRGDTILHTACRWVDGPALDVIQFLANQRPEYLSIKDREGRTPLAMACQYRSSFEELLIFLIEKYPNAVKETDSEHWTPLHAACYSRASLRVITLLADRYPNALCTKTVIGETPLHLACTKGATLGVVKLLVQRYAEALEIQNEDGLNPLQCAVECEGSSPQVIELLTALQSLNTFTDNDPQIRDMIRHFQEMMWPGGVALVLNSFPSVANKMDHKLMPDVFSLVGRRCNLDTFYMMLQDNPTLVKGAVKKGKRSEKPPAKKARTE